MRVLRLYRLSIYIRQNVYVLFDSFVLGEEIHALGYRSLIKTQDKQSKYPLNSMQSISLPTCIVVPFTEITVINILSVTSI